MLSNRDASEIMQLVDESLRDRERKREIVRRIEDMALGAYNTDGERREEPENMAFAVVAITLASMVQQPVSSITSDGDQASRMTAAATQGSVNQIARMTELRSTLRACGWDYLMGWAAAFIEISDAGRSDPTDEERSRITGPLQSGIASPSGQPDPAVRIKPEWVHATYLHPDQFFFDSKARTRTQWAFWGHSVVEDHDDLIERAEADPETWDVEVVKALGTMEDPATLQYAMSRGERAVDRNKVLYYVVYFPNGKIKGKKPGPWEYGVIRTISPDVSRTFGGESLSSSGKEIRPPYYHKGHPGGPWVFAGQYTQTRDSFPITALLANLDSVDMLNAVAANIHDRIRHHTLKFAFDSKQEEAVERIRTAPDGAWVPVPNLKDAAIQPIETGGPTPSEIRELLLLQQRAAANLALDDAMRGRADPDATATSIEHVAATSNSRAAFALSDWRAFVGAILERFAVHVLMNDTFFLRLDDDGKDEYRRAVLESAIPHIERQLGVKIMGADRDELLRRARPVAVPYAGGDFKDRPDAWWDLRLTVRPESMEPDGGFASAVRQQAIDSMLSFYGQAMLTMPHVNWIQRAREHFASIGAAGSERLLDGERASTLVGIQIASAEPMAVTGDSMMQKPQTPGLASIAAMAGGGGGRGRSAPPGNPEAGMDAGATG